MLQKIRKTRNYQSRPCFAGMDQKDDKPKKGSSLRSKAVPKATSYTDGIDPPCDEEDEGESDDEEERHKEARRKQKSEQRHLDISVTDKEQKKREMKERSALKDAEKAKREALKDDHDAFTVVIGSKTSVLEGEDTAEADANVKDITIGSFSVSARGKELLKNASVKISHGKRYGLVGPNGMGKSTLLKLLAWRKIPVPKNIDLLLVEQEVVGDEKSALNAVVSANEELVKLREEAEALQKSSAGADGENVDDVTGEKLAELSGGQKARVVFTSISMSKPHILLLDEPTNHLDMQSIDALANALDEFTGGVVLVSHDSRLILRVCAKVKSQIWVVEGGTVNIFQGTFEEYIEDLQREIKAEVDE